MFISVLQKAQGHREPVGEIRVLIAAGRGDVEGAQRSTVVAVREDVDLIGSVQRRQVGGKVQRVRGGHTRTSYTASQDVKNALGHFGYLLESLRDLDTLRPYKVRITADGETLDGEYLFGAVANSTSIAGMMKLEREEVILDDGLFELLLVPHPQNAAELQNLIWALLNQHFQRTSRSCAQRADNPGS